MSSMHRTITGDVLVQHLGSDALTIDQDLVVAHGRSSRTLVKEGPLRLTIMALAPDGTLPPHSTESSVSIHLLHGDLTVFALDQQYTLAAADVLILGPGVEHAARSASGASFLLTVAYDARAIEASRGSRASDHALSEAAKQRWLDDGGRLPRLEVSRDRR